MPLTANRIHHYLNQQDVGYTRLIHRRDHNGQQTSRDRRKLPNDFAQVVGLDADGWQFLAVLPADYYIDLPRLKQALGVKELRVLPEHSLATFFPDCEQGAFPPLGNLYGLPVVIDESLADYETITFNAGTLDEAIQLDYDTFVRLARPQMMDFALVDVRWAR